MPLHPPLAPSALARMQRSLMWAGAALCTTWLFFTWPHSPAWAIGGLIASAWGHAAVLALEFAAAAAVNRNDSVAPPSAMQRMRAWWAESTLTPNLFLWRQPFRWRDFPDNLPGEAPAASGPAVVLIHGLVCNRGFWAPWMQALRKAGVPYTSVNLEPVFGSIDEGVGQVENAVARAQALSAMPPTLVCHSMGGLAARAWLASAPGNHERVGRVITIGSPHHGTWLARWSRATNGLQMRQDSAWLQTLVAQERLVRGEAAYAKFTCFYSNADHIVIPVSTAMLPGADNHHVTGQAHVALAFHPTVMRESLAMLMPPGISAEARTAA